MKDSGDLSASMAFLTTYPPGRRIRTRRPPPRHADEVPNRSGLGYGRFITGSNLAATPKLRDVITRWSSEAGTQETVAHRWQSHGLHTDVARPRDSTAHLDAAKCQSLLSPLSFGLRKKNRRKPANSEGRTDCTSYCTGTGSRKAPMPM
jgi:hypothetical protein